MQIELSGSAPGVFALGRPILKAYPKAHIAFELCHQDTALNDESFWALGLEYILASVTRFGRIGIFYDHNAPLNYLKKGLSAVNIKKAYHPKYPKRAEKSPRIEYFPTQILEHMAMQGWGSSVEFRRIARKFLREAKNHNCDTVFFPYDIFAETSTQKTLQQIAGTQLKVVTLADVVLRHPDLAHVEEGEKRELVFNEAFSVFDIERAEQILQTKLPAQVKDAAARDYYVGPTHT